MNNKISRLLFLILTVNLGFSNDVLNNLETAPLANYSINVTASSSSDYTLSGTDFSGSVSGDDPNLTFYVGDVITFTIDATGHPLYI